MKLPKIDLLNYTIKEDILETAYQIQNLTQHLLHGIEELPMTDTEQLKEIYESMVRSEATIACAHEALNKRAR